jgi:tRNA (adenine57-N1/adenine58-N1)-methyltransferase
MSFAKYRDLIEENDTVVLYISFTTMYPITVTPKKINKVGENLEHVFQTTYGALKVKDLIGKRFGTKVRLSRGYGYALYPTPELWTRCLPHRTQILYSTDIAFITTQLELRPGSVVVESGTGSGSLSHAIARTVAPDGHLHTFDFHQQRADMAKKEFEEHGLGDCVTAKCADACVDGFGLEDVADAVFLDLPHPWDAVPHAQRAMKKTTGTARICSFSPCIEQVQKTCEALRQVGFNEISTVECLLKEFQVRRITVSVYEADRKSSTNKEEQEAAEAESRKRKLDEKDAPKDPEKSFVTGLPLVSMAGHTGYLTFATLPATALEADDLELKGSQ